MATTVHVEGISTKTSEDEIKSFFSFCGKIASISVTPTGADAQSASVTFEKPAAAKTALLLDNTQLGPNSVTLPRLNLLMSSPTILEKQTTPQRMARSSKRTSPAAASLPNISHMATLSQIKPLSVPSPLINSMG